MHPGDDARLDGAAALCEAEDAGEDLPRLLGRGLSPYADEVDVVEQAATSLSTHLSAATSAPSADTIAPLRGDIEALGNSVTALVEDVEGTC